jgi:putative peptidoglycan lipid II flippase
MTTQAQDGKPIPPPPPPSRNDPEPAAVASATRASSLVAAGILLSRVAGLARERVFAHYFGTSLYADAFRAGLRMPNVLQNLLGEGTLSASFIPVYAELLEQGREEEAGRVAGAIFSLLFALAGLLSLVGVLFAPVLTTVLLPGFEGERREVTILITQVIFPMTGVLVLSAWSLGILNSHRNFFVPYFAPVLWNGAMIGTLVLLGGGMSQRQLILALAWGALLGGVLQLAIQLPWVLRLERRLKLSTGRGMAPVREVVRNAGPAIMGRGVVQLSGYIDMVLASFIGVGAVAILGYAQTIYILPVSLFGMSVAAAELPELSRQRGAAVEVLRERTRAGLARVAFYVVPTAVAFLALGDTFVAALYQTGRFDRAQTLLVFAALAAYTVGLLASTGTRLFSSAFFALRDTRTPAKIAALRVLVAAVLGFVLMVQFEPIHIQWIGLHLSAGLWGGVRIAGQPLGAVGLALGAGLAAWLEWTLLRRALRKRMGPVGVGAGYLSRLFAGALAGAAAGWGIRLLVELHPVWQGLLVMGGYGAVYFAVTGVLGVAEARVFFGRAGRLLGRR